MIEVSNKETGLPDAMYIGGSDPIENDGAFDVPGANCCHVTSTTPVETRSIAIAKTATETATTQRVLKKAKFKP